MHDQRASLFLLAALTQCCALAISGASFHVIAPTADVSVSEDRQEARGHKKTSKSRFDKRYKNHDGPCGFIITTNVTGCREVVDNGVNGLLCRPRDAADLTEKMLQMLAFAPDKRQEMGRAGRDKVLRLFDERRVIRRYLDRIDLIRHCARSGSALEEENVPEASRSN